MSFFSAFLWLSRRSRPAGVRSPKRLLRKSVGLRLEELEDRRLLTAFTVNSLGDQPDGYVGDGWCDTGRPGSYTGICTLRAAIMEDASAIDFSVAGTIQVGAPLPANRIPVIIDGRGVIALRGGTHYGLWLTGGNSTVRGMEISGFQVGLEVVRNNNVIQGNYIHGNSQDGIYLSSSTNSTIGGPNPRDRNVISGNGWRGLVLQDSPSNLIEGNYIGTDRTGTQARGSQRYQGVYLLRSNTNTIRSNLISGNEGDGLLIDQSHLNRLEDNSIGPDVNGTRPLGNRFGLGTIGSDDIILRGNHIYGNIQVGIHLSSARNGTIQENHIHGNGQVGIDLSSSINCRIRGNYIHGNTLYGVYLRSSTNNTIGGQNSGDRNVSSENGWGGLGLDRSTNNLIEGNYIGTDRTGTEARGNRRYQGVVLLSRSHTNTIRGNVVSGTVENGGIRIDESNFNRVEGNFIGTDKEGRVALGNALYGVALTGGAANNTVGGTTAAARNIIAGNRGPGIAIQGNGTSDNRVEGNYIGTDKEGSVRLSNEGMGVSIGAGATNNTVGGLLAGARNVIAGNRGEGIAIGGSGTDDNRVEGNYIGTDKEGSVRLSNGRDGVIIFDGASRNTVGGTAAGAYNLISGNAGGGVLLFGPGTTGNLVQGNLIGADVYGTGALYNDGDGVSISSGASNNLIGGTDPNAPNLISGNARSGVFIYGSGTSGNWVQGNNIGTNEAGTDPLANGGDGVTISFGASNNTIGGAEEGAGNKIAFNTGAGIVVGWGATDLAIRNQIRRNSIHANTRSGIDLGNDDVTPLNVCGTRKGPNHLQSLPVILARERRDGTNRVRGTLHSLANTKLILEFFASPAAHRSGFGQGQRFLAETTVTTDGSCRGTFEVNLPAAGPSEVIAATATDRNGNTSEFSNAVVVEDVNVHASDTHTFKTDSVLSKDRHPLLHFVTARQQGPFVREIVLVATLQPDTPPEIRDRLTWATTARGIILTSPAIEGDTRTATIWNNIHKGRKIPLQIQLAGITIREIVAWVVSADIKFFDHQPELDVDRRERGTVITARIDATATIRPAEIISEEDIPNLRGEARTSPPPGKTVCGEDLSRGVNVRWDMSRRIRIRASTSNPRIRLDCADTSTNFPTDPVVGNDDPSTADENNNPYVARVWVAAGRRRNLAIGQLGAFDNPITHGPESLTAGVVGDTYTSMNWFQEFVRLQLGSSGSARWFVISDFVPWCVIFRMRKVAGTHGGYWANDGSYAERANRCPAQSSPGSGPVGRSLTAPNFSASVVGFVGVYPPLALTLYQAVVMPALLKESHSAGPVVEKLKLCARLEGTAAEEAVPKSARLGLAHGMGPRHPLASSGVADEDILVSVWRTRSGHPANWLQPTARQQW